MSLKSPIVIDLCSATDDESGDEAVSRERIKRRSGLGNLQQEDSFKKTRTCEKESKKPETAEQLLKRQVLIYIEGSDDAVVTDGIIPFLQAISIYHPGISTLCGEGAMLPSTLQHIAQQEKWSCGFRNTQMMMTALIPFLPKHHSYYEFTGRNDDQNACGIPSRLQIQKCLEECWKAGYDRKGAEHYHYRLAQTTALIGAVEVSNYFAYSGVDSAVVQFMKCIESRTMLIPFCEAYFSKCIRNYSQRACPICCVKCGTESISSSSIAEELLQKAAFNKSKDDNSQNPSAMNAAASLTSFDTTGSCTCPTLPLYLQWTGHSVTVVGVERRVSTGQVKHLLVFDPLKNGADILNSLRSGDAKVLRIPVKMFEKKDCQIVLCSSKTISPAEKEKLKSGIPALTAAQEAVLRALQR